MMQVPAIYLIHIADVVRDRGFDPLPLLAEGRLDERSLLAEGARVDAIDYANLALRAMARTDDECLGCALGLRMPVTAHGVLGMAAVNRPSLRDALDMGVRYMAIATPFVSLSISSAASTSTPGQEDCVITVKETTALGPLRRFVLESAAIGLLQAGASLLGTPMKQMPFRIAFPWPPSPAFEHHRAHLPPATFNGGALTLRAPAHLMDTPLPLHEPRSAHHLEQACREALTQFKHRGSVKLQVLSRLKPGPSGYPQREEVARALGVSVRTLLRQLEEQGTTFQALLQLSQRREAEALLREGRLSIEAIALRLGYQDPANFSRAFKRWTKVPPRVWREQLSV